MKTELDVLKKIWENNAKSYPRLISHQTGLGIDYTRYVCSCLLKKELIKPDKEERDWYRITPQGKKELRLWQIIKPKVFSRIIPVGKLIDYFPRKFKIRLSKSNFQRGNLIHPVKSAKGGVEQFNRVKPGEKILNLGRSIGRAVSFLKKNKRLNKDF
ncbi:MAG: hypothetical protein WC650_02640 [Candidatus Doudnabacteria bacterium]